MLVIARGKAIVAVIDRSVQFTFISVDGTAGLVLMIEEWSEQLLSARWSSSLPSLEN